MSAYNFTIDTPTNPWVIAHELGDSRPFWSIYDSTGESILPTSAVATSEDVFTFTFDEPITGGGSILSVLDVVSFASSASLTDLATVKSALGIAASDSSENESLSRLIVGVSEAMKNYMRRRIVETAHAAETYNGNGRSALILRERPVLVASGVEVSIADSELPSADYVVDYAAGMLECQPGIIFPRGVGNVAVSYVSGYEDGVPADLNLACVHQVIYERRLHGSRDQIALLNSTIAGAVSESYRTDPWAQGVRETMARYRSL